MARKPVHLIFGLPIARVTYRSTRWSVRPSARPWAAHSLVYQARARLHSSEMPPDQTDARVA
eukprot:1173153-Lingulodinium_polyedra.AAC.1